ncbi:hypothetical protein LIA77_00110 [Sarocladium implicatum]|nr:hypothetical protein LIA77_00110 [Sarocladium implicatum]
MTLMDFRPKPISVFTVTLPEDPSSSMEALSEIPEEGSSVEQANDAHICKALLQTLDGASPSLIGVGDSGNEEPAIEGAAKKSSSTDNATSSKDISVIVREVPSRGGASDAGSPEQLDERGGNSADEEVETENAQEEPESSVTNEVQASQPTAVAIHAVKSPAAEMEDDMSQTLSSGTSKKEQAEQADGSDKRRRGQKTVGFSPGVVTQAPVRSMLETAMSDEELKRIKERQAKARASEIPVVRPVQSMVTPFLDEFQIQEMNERNAKRKGIQSVPPASDPTWQIEHEREQRRTAQTPRRQARGGPLPSLRQLAERLPSVPSERPTGPGR